MHVCKYSDSVWHQRTLAYRVGGEEGLSGVEVPAPAAAGMFDSHTHTSPSPPPRLTRIMYKDSSACERRDGPARTLDGAAT